MPQTAVGVARNASPKYVWDQYQQSVAISPWPGLAFMVSNYGFTEAFTQQGVPYRSWYTKKMLNQTQYATQAGLKIMNYLQENIFKPSYPIDKMDQIAKADFHQLLAHLAHLLQSVTNISASQLLQLAPHGCSHLAMDGFLTARIVSIY